MSRFSIFVRLALALASVAPAPTRGAPADQAAAAAIPESGDPGKTLAAELRSLRPEENTEFKGVLKIRRRDGQTSAVPVRGQVVAGGNSWQTIYETAATNDLSAEKLVVIHSAERPNQYLYERGKAAEGASAEPKPLAGDQIWTALAGSDFVFADLGMEFLHWPEQRLIKRNEMRKGRPCRLLESRIPRYGAGGYARVLSWVDQESGGVLAAEAYDAADKLIKEFSLRSFRKIGGRWQLQEMEIRSVRTGSRTRLEFIPQ
jgi:hypothetical protein